MIKIKGKFHTKLTFCRHLLTLTLFPVGLTYFFYGTQNMIYTVYEYNESNLGLGVGKLWNDMKVSQK